MQKSSISDNLVPPEFSSKFGSLIKAVLGGLDRLRLCGTLRPLFTPRWMNIYLCAAKVLLKDYSKHAQALTERVCQRARQIAESAGRPYLYVASAPTSKEALIEQIARRDRISEGLVAVLSAVEPCVAISVRGDATKKRLSPVVQTRKCLHLYHYYEHPILGRCHLRLQSWYPFTVDVCLNGRAWLARQLDAEGLAYCRADNCFVALQDPGRAQALADAQLLADWPQLLQELLRQAHPLHGEILSPLPALHYYCPQSNTQTASQSKARRWQRLRRSIVDLPRRAEVSRVANRRYLQALAATQGNIALGQAAAGLTVAVRWQGRRYRGIHPLEPNDSALLEAIARGQWSLGGFRNRDIRSHLFKATPKNPSHLRCQSAAIGRRLRLLRAHRIIRKIPRTHRYILTPHGRNLVTALLAAQHADTQKLTALAA